MFHLNRRQIIEVTIVSLIVLGLLLAACIYNNYDDWRGYALIVSCLVLGWSLTIAFHNPQARHDTGGADGGWDFFGGDGGCGDGGD